MKNADHELARRLLAGDERAFADVFDDFFPRLYRYALVRVDGNRDEARDIVQQTFCKAFERLGTFRGEAPLFAWMCRICRNTLIDRARRREREGGAPPIAGADDVIDVVVDLLRAPPSDEPEHALARTRLIELIQMTLDCLPARYGDVLEWKYVEGLSVVAIAAKLGVGPKAAESMLSRARRAFREAIRELNGQIELWPGDIGRAPGR